MDNLTHTLLGVAMAKAGISRRIGKGAAAALVIGSNLTDMDVFLALTGQDYFLHRRMFTHSVLGMSVLALLGACVFKYIYRSKSWWVFFALLGLGMVVHVFFDLVNSYGVVLFYPWSIERYELAWFFIVDLALWAALLLPFFSPRAFRERCWRLALSFVALYVALCAVAHRQAGNLLAEVSGPRAQFRHVFPEPFGPHRFRGVIREGDIYRVYLLNVLTGEKKWIKDFTTQENDVEVRRVRQSPRARELSWFFKAPVWKKTPGSDEVEVFDLRFYSILLLRETVPFTRRFNLRLNQAESQGGSLG